MWEGYRGRLLPFAVVGQDCGCVPEVVSSHHLMPGSRKKAKCVSVGGWGFFICCCVVFFLKERKVRRRA